MSVSLSVDGPGDAELISAVRGGDVDAYGELFARHVDAARRLARQLAGPADADDLVSDAFTKVLLVLQRGGGPDLAFRAYLLTAVRRLHVDRIRSGARLRPVDDLTPFDPGLPFHDTAVEGFENAAAARAFASLPERWQMVLWHTEVEQQKPADIAPLLGMSANSVSALAYRAREGLRQAFLSQHATDPDDVDCAWTRDHLGAYVRGGLSRRDSARVDDHLAACRACAAVYLELTEVNSGLGALLAPLLLGTAGAGYLSSSGVGTGGVFSTGFAAAKTWAVAHASLTAVGGMVVAATTVLTIYGATHLGGSHNAADIGSPPLLDRVPVATGLPSATDGAASPSGDRGRTGTPGGDAASAPAIPGPSTTQTGPDTAPALVGDSTPPAGEPGQSTSPEPGDPTTSDPGSPTSQPTDSPTTQPTDPATSQPTDPATSQPTDPPSTQPTDPPTTQPTDPTTSQPTDPATSEPTDPATSEPTDPASTPTTPPAVRITSEPPVAPAFGQTYEVLTDDPDVDLSLAGTTNAACSATGMTVRFDHAGQCVITVSRQTTSFAASADDAGGSGDPSTQTIVVPQEAQSLSLTPPPSGPAQVGSVVTVAGSPTGNPIDVQVGNADVCTAVGTVVTFLNPGTCDISATQEASADYAEATLATSVSVVAVPPSTDLKVTAEQQSTDNNWARVRATVENLPDGSQATVTISPDGNYALSPSGGSDCQKTGPASYVCTVSSAQPWVDLDVNVHQGESRVIEFEVAPVSPLVDSDLTDNTFRLQLDN